MAGQPVQLGSDSDLLAHLILGLAPWKESQQQALLQMADPVGDTSKEEGL